MRFRRFPFSIVSNFFDRSINKHWCFFVCAYDCLRFFVVHTSRVVDTHGRTAKSKLIVKTDFDSAKRTVLCTYFGKEKKKRGLISDTCILSCSLFFSCVEGKKCLAPALRSCSYKNLVELKTRWIILSIHATFLQSVLFPFHLLFLIYHFILFSFFFWKCGWALFSKMLQIRIHCEEEQNWDGEGCGQGYDLKS